MEIDDGEKKKRGACEVVKRAMVVSWGDDVAQARIAGEPKQQLEAEPGRELAEAGKRVISRHRQNMIEIPIHPSPMPRHHQNIMWVLFARP
jgi:hypothetical protein